MQGQEESEWLEHKITVYTVDYYNLFIIIPFYFLFHFLFFKAYSFALYKSE